MSSDTAVGPVDVVERVDAPEAADAVAQMAAATQSLRAGLPLLQGTSPEIESYPR